MSLSSLSENDQVARSVTSPSVILQPSQSYLILALVLTVFAVVPLFYPGYIQTHSGFVSMWNVADLRANLGDWRWLPHIATSFDLLRSDGLWPYYLAAILPFESAKAVKGILGLSWLLGSAGMFLWLKNGWGQPGALLAALVYTYLPYQIATVYVRGAWGEAFFWGLLPWAILVSDSTRKPTPLLSILGASLWLILGLSQLGLTSWAFIFVALLLLFSRGWQVTWPILSALLGLALAAAITLAIFSASPFPYSPPLIHFSDHFLYPFQLFSAQWGFGPSRLGWKDGLSFQLGLAAIGLTILTVMLWLQRRSSDPAIKFVERPLVFFMGGAIVCILLQFGFTEPFW
ncbi:MAG TPA: hypothetical protein VEC93_17480, partial [Anaerolineae bacterium]|nr:hypothetical protein [Anaerolineae bacterium]